MNTIVLLTNVSQYPYHKSLQAMLVSFFSNRQDTLHCLDIRSTKYPHQCLARLTSLSPDILITLDLAGFHFRTQTGENALNMLYTKNLNLLWGNRPQYGEFLQKKISLSMLFYDITGQDHQIPVHYPNVLYYKAHPDFSLFIDAPASMKSPIALSNDTTMNAAHFQNIWNDFVQEALLI